MKWEHKTDEQLAAEAKEAQANYLIPDGAICDFQILESVAKVSKKAAEKGETEPNMFALKVAVYKENGDTVPMYDYVMPSFYKKFSHCLSSIGMDPKSGTAKAEDLIFKSGKCIVGQEVDFKDNTRLRNIIKDYVKKSGASVKTDDLNDEITF